MGKQFYTNRNFRADSLAMIERCNAIIEDYIEQGYRLTVRQLYYQLVAGAVIENTERSYKNITNLVNDAKLAGLMDWDAIEDRTRAFVRRTRWASGREIVDATASNFHMDMWVNQPKRVFVIVEKEALAGVLEGPCQKFDVPLLAARGYPSGTVLREFCQLDLLDAIDHDQEIVILHLGDHDPSGIDMTRDLRERIEMFGENSSGIEMQRIALNFDQITSQKPPPNPAKSTDSRFAAYIKRFGTESWELDALKPSYLDKLVQKQIRSHIDEYAWQERDNEVEEIREKISAMAEQFEG